MNKPMLLLMAPVNTVSGYGHRSVDIALSLINSDKRSIGFLVNSFFSPD